MSKRLTLQDLVDVLAENKGITKKDAENFVRELFAVISENIEKKDSVRIKDFGTFKLVKVNSRKSVDVNTGEDIEIPAHYKLGFTPDKSLRDRINAPFAHFETTLLNDGVNFEDTEELSETLETLVNEDVDDAVDNGEETTSDSEIEPKTEAVQIIESTPVSEEIIETIIEEPFVVEDIIEPTEEIVGAESEATTHSEIEEMTEPLTNNVEEKVVPLDKAEMLEEDGPEEEKGDSKALVWILITCAILLIAGGVYVFKDQIFGARNTSPILATRENTLSDSLNANNVIVDSLSIVTDTIPEEVLEGKVEVLVPIDTIKIEYGDTMRKLGLRYYGNRSFWVYIYIENSDKIVDFNNVPIGTSLVIPAAEKYGIDAQNEESLTRARELEKAYWEPAK